MALSNWPEEPLNLLKMKKIKLFTIAALMLGFVSCQKEENNTVTEGNKPAPTKKEMLTAKTWKLTAMTISPAVNGKTDVFPMVEACEKDNTWKFYIDKSSNTLTIDEGMDICKGKYQQISTDWELDEQDNKLIIDSYDYTVMSISASEFQIQETWNDQGVDYTLTSTYSGN
jgi:hypothetical protein